MLAVACDAALRSSVEVLMMITLRLKFLKIYELILNQTLAKPSDMVYRLASPAFNRSYLTNVPGRAGFDSRYPNSFVLFLLVTECMFVCFCAPRVVGGVLLIVAVYCMTVPCDTWTDLRLRNTIAPFGEKAETRQNWLVAEFRSSTKSVTSCAN